MGHVELFVWFSHRRYVSNVTLKCEEWPRNVKFEYLRTGFNTVVAYVQLCNIHHEVWSVSHSTQIRSIPNLPQGKSYKHNRVRTTNRSAEQVSSTAKKRSDRSRCWFCSLNRAVNQDPTLLASSILPLETLPLVRK